MRKYEGASIGVSEFVFVPALLAAYILGIRLSASYANIGLLAGVLLILFLGRHSFAGRFPYRWVLISSVWVLGGCYCALQSIFHGYDFTPFTLICIGVLASLLIGRCVGAYYVRSAALHGDEVIDRIIVAIFFAAFLNSSLILIEFFVEGVKSVIEGLLLQNSGGNIDYANHPFRLRGVAAGGGASLSMFNAISLIGLLGWYVGRRSSPLKVLLLGGVICASNVFVGRTGLIYGLIVYVVLCGVCFQDFLRRGLGMIFFQVIVVASFGGAIYFWMRDYEFDPAAIEWAFEWLGAAEGGGGGVHSVNELSDMLFLPENPFHLLFGIGFFEGDGGIYERTDSGYLKTLFSAGLVGSVLLYGSLVLVGSYVYSVASRWRRYLVVMAIVMAISEIKEPFLYQNYTARALLVLGGAAMFIFDRDRCRRSLVE